jgi:hypothetical protein
MKKHHRNSTAAFALAIAAVATTTHASDLYWQGGTADLGGPNYFEPISAASNVAPTDGDDALYIGADGTATSATDLSVGRIVVGHTGTSTESAPGAFPGAGAVDITGGTLSLNTGVGTVPIGTNTPPGAGLIIGHAANGSFSISNATVNVNDSVVVGASTDATVAASLAVNAGGTLNLAAGGLQVGGNGTAALAGAGGTLTVNGGTVNVSGTGADLSIGVWNRSTYVQTGGTVTVADETFVGRRNADFSSFTLSGGATFNTRNLNVADTTGNGRIDDVTVNVTDSTLTITNLLGIGENNSRRAAVTIGQGSVVTVGGAVNVAGASVSAAAATSLVINGNASLAANSFTVGNNTANNSSLTITDNAVVTTNSHITVGNNSGAGTANNSSFTLSGNASVRIGEIGGATAAHLFLGRGSTTNTTFNQSGTSTLTIDNLYLMGTGPNPTGVVTNHSGGTVNVGQDIRLSDTGGVSTYNFSGTGVINSTQGIIVARQKGSGTFNQTGGTANYTGRLRVGDAENVDKTLWGTGVYNVSAGNIAVTVPEGTTLPALSIAPAGTGTFRVIGDDSTITVGGDVLVNATAAVDTFPAFVGTLAYQLEAGDASLSTVAATGIATFAAGSVLQLDFNAVEPTQGLFTLLTAADVIDNGLTFAAPAGWTRQVVPATGGKALRVFAGDLNADGRVNPDDYALLDRNAARGLTGGANGDFNADGSINAEDYFLIDSAFGQLGNPLSPDFLALRASQFGQSYVAALVASVPEPASLAAACGLALPALLTRRRRA